MHGFQRSGRPKRVCRSKAQSAKISRNGDGPGGRIADILADGGVIRSEHLPVGSPRHVALSDAPGGSAAFPVGGVNLEAIERSLVLKALTQARHNKTRAAKLLGLTRAQLYSRIEKYGLAESES